MTAVLPTASAIAVLALAFVASAGVSEAASDRPLRQLRAAIHDMFSPPRRTRRAKAKPARTTVAVAPAQPVPEPQRRPEAAQARPERVARLPAAKEEAPAPRPTLPAKPRGRPAQSATLPASTEAPAKDAKPSGNTAEPAQPPALPAKPRGRPPQSAALPPSTEAPAKGSKPPGNTAGPAQPPALPAKPRGRPPQSAALPPAAEAPAKDAKPSSDTADPAPPPGPSACQLRLTPELAAVQLLPSVSAGQCTVDDVVRLEAVMAKDGRRVALNPPATLRCPMAEAVIHWVRDELTPATADAGSPLKALAVDTSFECRGRNRVVGAKLSEHGHANAIDVRAITLVNGSALTFTDMSVDKALRERLKQGACARFTTVLGPGSDGYHESHIHLDFIQRRGGYRMCQWDVRDVADVRPMPRERPADAPPRTASTGKPAARN